MERHEFRVIKKKFHYWNGSEKKIKIFYSIHEVLVDGCGVVRAVHSEPVELSCHTSVQQLKNSFNKMQLALKKPVVSYEMFETE